jgi:uncharacterized protein
MQVANIDIDSDRLAEICDRYGVAELSVFGSYAAGYANAQSDVDLLYVLRPDAHLGWDIECLAEELGELFGRAVDLVSKRYLHRLLRDEVLRTARVLYAA